MKFILATFCIKEYLLFSLHFNSVLSEEHNKVQVPRFSSTLLKAYTLHSPFSLTSFNFLILIHNPFSAVVAKLLTHSFGNLGVMGDLVSSNLIIMLTRRRRRLIQWKLQARLVCRPTNGTRGRLLQSRRWRSVVRKRSGLN